MKRSLFILALSIISLCANSQLYELHKNGDTEPTFFIKIGACKSLDNAVLLQNESTLFDTQIINLRNYHSVLTQEFETKEEAVKYLTKVKKRYNDAYIISLYKKQEVKSISPAVAPLEVARSVVSSYDKGLALYRVGRYEEALASFDRALIDDDSDMSSHLFYAKSLYKLSMDKEADEEFKKILNSRSTKREKIEAREFIKAIEKNRKRSFYKTSISLGVGYDDNIDLTTDKKTTKYGAYTLENDTDKKSSTYALVSLSLAHRYDMGTFDIISSFYSYNELAHSADGNDLNFLDLKSGISKRFSDLNLYVPIGANISYLDGEDVGYNIYTSPTLRYFINKNFITSLEATYLDNRSKYMQGRDYKMLGLNSGLIYKTKSSESGVLGGMNQFDSKDDLRFDVDKDVKNINIYSFYTFYKNSLSLYGSYSKEDYTRLDSAMGYKRVDKILRYGLNTRRDITDNISTTLGYKHIKNDSNINVYAYDKNSYIFDVKYRF